MLLGTPPQKYVFLPLHPCSVFLRCMKFMYVEGFGHVEARAIMYLLQLFSAFLFEAGSLTELEASTTQ